MRAVRSIARTESGRRWRTSLLPDRLVPFKAAIAALSAAEIVAHYQVVDPAWLWSPASHGTSVVLQRFASELGVGALELVIAAAVSY
ncbi:hypothetical protein [Hoyosella subflava]|uniref:Uncharacterized protein n=1 Tax=Hoyosella subflava (strain DSM 45089 / JCM 17490 / NBRC 109087 / DQS3-9A1) TaxID=443218 RepID=F6ELB9_HOYSD|nr:hypothetical protein [Hoyosella subflava]AEF39211.1 hypothetical protein AS9A_0757 [Hoyosella subflava DQS3-9A1]